MLNRPILRIAGVGLVVLLAASGCGGSGETTAPAPATQVVTTPRAPRLQPDQDIATICPRLARKARTIVQQANNHPAPRLSTQRLRATNFSSCRLGAKDVAVRMTLDTAAKVKKRYDNRITESQQFSSQTKGLFPHPVGGIGDLHASGGGANWLPVFNQLLSIRGNHMLAMTFYVKGLSKDGLLSAAKKLALTTWGALGVPRHRGIRNRNASNTPRGF